MRRPWLLGLGLGLAMLLVVDAIAARAGLTSGLIPTLAGTAAWTTSRAAGVTAFAALTADVLFGLAVSTGVIDRWLARGRVVEVHRWLASVALALTGAHALALVLDRVVRFDVLDVVVPFLSPYRAGAVALGIAAAYGAVVVHVSFGLRTQIGHRAWRTLHALSFVVFAGALAHGLLAGTDRGLPAMRAFYLITAGAVALLTIARGGRSLLAARARLAPAMCYVAPHGMPQPREQRRQGLDPVLRRDDLR
jgi:predicted ferric reductase